MSGGLEDTASVDAEVVTAARGGGLSFAGAAFNQVLRLGITLGVARGLGPAGAGAYFQAFAFLSLLGIVCSGGVTFALTRFVAVHRVDGDDASLAGTVRIGLLVATGASVVLGIALGVAAGPLARGAFADPPLAGALRVAALALPFTVFTDAALAATRGFKTMKPYVSINLVFEPVARIALTGVALSAGFGLRGAMTALLLTNVAAAILAAAALVRLLGGVAGPATYEWRELLAFSAVTLVSSLAGNALLWADTIILGLYRPPRDVALYQVATRLTLLATLALTPVAAAFAPQIADLYHRREMAGLRRLYTVVTSWCVRLSLPSFVILFLYPHQLLNIFGRHYPEAASVTVILSLGQLVNVVTGPVAYMLVMSGRPAIVMQTSVAGLGLNVGLNLWLIPRYGVTGAALAWAVAIAVINVVRVVQVWLNLRMGPLDRGFAKGAAAGLGAFAVGGLVRLSVHGFARLLVGAPLVLAVYTALILAFGITAEDRLVLDRVRQRLRPAYTG